MDRFFIMLGLLFVYMVFSFYIGVDSTFIVLTTFLSYFSFIFGWLNRDEKRNWGDEIE
jgi:hypothetical protein